MLKREAEIISPQKIVLPSNLVINVHYAFALGVFFCVGQNRDEYTPGYMQH